MSSIKLESNASGTGIFTIASPNSNTNRTLTIPDATGTIITTAGGAAISGTTGAFTSTVGVGGATPAASGAGITFPATASASSDANTLDDYEEGTWTATLNGSSGNPTPKITSTAIYTKIGNLVTVNVSFENISTASYSGDAYITGLPFTSKSSYRAMGSLGNYSSLSWSAGYTPIPIITSNVTIIDFQQIQSNGAWSAAVWGGGGSGRYLWVTITYFV